MNNHLTLFIETLLISFTAKSPFASRSTVRFVALLPR
jgi:hypothetical protein